MANMPNIDLSPALAPDKLDDDDRRPQLTGNSACKIRAFEQG